MQIEGNASEKAKSRLDVQIRRKLTVLDNLKRQHAWGDWSDAEYIYERDKVKAGNMFTNHL